MIETSRPWPWRTSFAAVDGASVARHPRRRGSPTTMRVMLRSRAYSARAAAAEAPSSVTVCAPRDSARRSAAMRRLRARSPSLSSAGVSTDTTSHSASSASAKRLPTRTSCSAWSFGAMAIRNRSRASQGRELRSSPEYARAAASTRSAVRRNASSRSAVRLGRRKNRSAAVAALSATYTLPDFNRASRSSGGRSISSTSSASSKILSGIVSSCRTPVIPATTSFRLSRCWMFSVVQTLMPALEQLLDILPALRVTRARLAFDDVRVRELIDQQRRGPALQRRIEIELAARHAAVAHIDGASCSRPSSSFSVSTRPCGST